MLTETLQLSFKRDLEKLKSEIEQYHDEQNIWLVEQSIANSAGNLCLHLVGNLSGFIGAQLGNSGYVRNRDLEFTDKGVPRAELLAKIDAMMPVVMDTLQNLTPEQLAADYPIAVFNNKVTSTEYMLMHLVTHLSYHLGQINYHRRLLDK